MARNLFTLLLLSNLHKAGALALGVKQPASGSASLGSKRRASTSRGVAHEVLLRCARDGAFAGRALDSALKRSNFSPSDAGLVTQLVYGVLRSERLLDHSIGQARRYPYTHAPTGLAQYTTLPLLWFSQLAPRLDKVDNSTLTALRIGAFELLELRTADHAVRSLKIPLLRVVAARGHFAYIYVCISINE